MLAKRRRKIKSGPKKLFYSNYSVFVEGFYYRKYHAGASAYVIVDSDKNILCKNSRVDVSSDYYLQPYKAFIFAAKEVPRGSSIYFYCSSELEWRTILGWNYMNKLEYPLVDEFWYIARVRDLKVYFQPVTEVKDVGLVEIALCLCHEALDEYAKKHYLPPIEYRK